jgi:hypothetical protein
MRMVTFAMASLLSALAMLWLATANWRRFATDGEAASTPAEGIGLGLVLLYALGAICAFGQPKLTMVPFVMAGLLGVGAGLLGNVADLVVLGASAAPPAASSVISARQLG